MTKLNLKLGEKGRLIVEAKKPVNAESSCWKSYSDIVIIDASGQKTPMDCLVVAAKPGRGIIEYQVLDNAGEKVLEYTFEVEVTEQISDADLVGQCRVSRESDVFEVPEVNDGGNSIKPTPDATPEPPSDDVPPVGSEDTPPPTDGSKPEPVMMGEAFPAPVSVSVDESKATAIGDTGREQIPANEASSVAGEALGAGSSPEAIADGAAIREENTPAVDKGVPIEGSPLDDGSVDRDMMIGHQDDAFKNGGSDPEAEPTGSTELPADYPPKETRNEATTKEEVEHAEEQTQIVGGEVGPHAVSTATEVVSGATKMFGEGGAAGEGTAADPDADPDNPEAGFEPASNDPDAVVRDPEEGEVLSFDTSDQIQTDAETGVPLTQEDVEAEPKALAEDIQDKQEGGKDEEDKPSF